MVRRPRIDVPRLQQNQLLAKQHQLGPFRRPPPVDGLLMQAQQSFDSEQKIELSAQANAIVVDEAAGDYVALAVEDTGAGMPPERHGPSIRSSRRRRWRFMGLRRDGGTPAPSL